MGASGFLIGIVGKQSVPEFVHFEPRTIVFHFDFYLGCLVQHSNLDVIPKLHGITENIL